MARLTEEEKSAFLALARSVPLPHQRPPILPIADYLRLISHLAQLPQAGSILRSALETLNFCRKSLQRL